MLIDHLSPTQPSNQFFIPELHMQVGIDDVSMEASDPCLHQCKINTDFFVQTQFMYVNIFCSHSNWVHAQPAKRIVSRAKEWMWMGMQELELARAPHMTKCWVHTTHERACAEHVCLSTLVPRGDFGVLLISPDIWTALHPPPKHGAPCTASPALKYN